MMDKDGNGITRVALVTGAGSGVGRAASRALAADGYCMVLAGRRQKPLKETTESLVRTEGQRHTVIPTDISQVDQVDTLFASVEREFGRLDVLFNNAGIGVPAIPMEDLPIEDWQRCVNINLTGAFICAQRAIRMMKTQDPRGGRIINNGSVSAHAPRPDTCPYTATKHAITGLTRCISLDGRKHDIACSQLDIGNADTALASKFKTGVPQANGEIAIEPTFDVEHCGSAIAYMASLPLNTNVQFMTVMATKMPYIGRG